MRKDAIINFVLPALNLFGVLLVVGGVFAFANALSNRSFNFGHLTLPSDPALAVVLIAAGFLIFGAAILINRISRK